MCHDEQRNDFLTYKSTAQILAVRKQVTVITEHLVRASETKMNFSQSSRIGNKSECKNLLFKTATLQYSSADSFYGLLVAAAVLNLAVCPFTIFLNALVMVAVKAKQGLQTHPNILLACLALTDLMVGLVVQPLHVTKTIFILQGKDAHEFCNIDLAFAVSLLIFSFGTNCQLLLISGERYLAIKHTFTHATVVTRTRLILSSAVLWIAAMVFVLVIRYLAIFFFISTAIVLFSIVLLHILVYKEARRHEKQILSQQVSMEARAKFNQEMRALRLTTIILVTLFICCLSPLIFVFVTWIPFSEAFSPHAKASVRHLALVPVIINSFLNPVIYTVRKKDFRVAFIELILRKSLEDAEEFNRRLFGSRNNTARQQIGQEGQGHEQNAENENASQPAVLNDNHEENPEVQVSGA